MQKTKLGISVGLMGALLYLMGLFGGYFIAIAAVAYVLIREENIWLRKTAVKVVILTFLFPVISTILGAIPDLVQTVNLVINIFDESFDYTVITRIDTLLQHILGIVRYVVFILLGIFALLQNTVKIPLVDSTVDKHMD